MSTETHVTLQALVDHYLWTITRNGEIRPNTIRCYGRTARLIVKAIGGDRQIRGITVRDVDDFFAARRAAGLSAATRNLDRVALRQLWIFATENYPREIKKDTPLLNKRRGFTEIPRPHLRIPASRFAEMLDQANSARDRIVLALGLYLMLRQGEIKLIRWVDVDLEDGYVNCQMPKTQRAKPMPISDELDRELRRWKTYVTNECGPINPWWYVACSQTRPCGGPGGFIQGSARLVPTKPTYQPERAMQGVLVKMGYPLRDPNGKSLREGMHTLRRSAARALFDRLCVEGYDGALKMVSNILGHKSVQMTERYLGIELDDAKAMEMFSGKPMYPVARENVSDLDKKRQEKESRDG